MTRQPRLRDLINDGTGLTGAQAIEVNQLLSGLSDDDGEEHAERSRIRRGRLRKAIETV